MIDQPQIKTRGSLKITNDKSILMCGPSASLELSPKPLPQIDITDDDCLLVWIGNGNFSHLREKHQGFTDLSRHLLSDEQAVLKGLKNLKIPSDKILILKDQSK